MHKTSLIFLVLISNCIFAQNKKLVIKHTDRNSRVSINKGKYIGIWSDSESNFGEVTSLDSNYIELRIWGEDKSKIEYLTFRSNKSIQSLKKDGWQVSDSLTALMNRNDTLIDKYYLFGKQVKPYVGLYRSTDLKRFSISEIDSIEATKSRGVSSGGGFGAVMFTLVTISTPIWNYDDEGHFQWETFAIVAGFATVSWSFILIVKQFEKYRMYDFKVYKVYKIKPIHTKKIPLTGT
jgi:hypothetical protein